MAIDYEYLDLSTIGALAPLAHERGVWDRLNPERGFLGVYASVRGNPDVIPDEWHNRRQATLNKHHEAIRVNDELLWENGQPTRRHLAMILWGYSPSGARLERYMRQVEEPTKVLANPAPAKPAISGDLEKRYSSSHWGVEGSTVYQIDDRRLPDELCEMGMLIELHVDDDGDEFEMEMPDGCLLAFSIDEAERLYIILPNEVCRGMKPLWRKGGKAGAPTYSLRQVAEHAGGRQAEPAFSYPNVKVRVLGLCDAVVYGTHKKGDGPSAYIHELGENSGVKPYLCISEDGQLWLAGGNYHVPDRGIVD